MIRKINELTSNIYEGFIIKKAEYNIEKNLLDVILVFPEKYYKKLTRDDKDVLSKTILQILNIDVKIKLEIEYSFSDLYVIKNTVCQFIAKEQPIYASNISVDDILIKAKSDLINIEFVLDSGTYTYFNACGFEEDLKKYLSYRFTQQVTTKLTLDKSKDAVIQNVEIVSGNIYSSNETRCLVIDNQEKLMGRAFMGTPSYIVDVVDNPKEQIVVCGKVSNIYTKFLEKSGKTLLKFNLNDTTGTINVVKFDKSKTEEYKKLEEGMEVVVQGYASVNDFDNKMQIIVNNISTCTIDYSSINLEPVYNQANPYFINVFPSEYVDIAQTSIFDKKEIPEYLIGKTFICFDLETTGLSSTDDKIIEIGACKMVDGEIIEVFETLVNPEIHIPESASKVNNIYDEDVARAPLIEDVFPDFYKYIEDFPLIGHNVEFDIGFINKVAKQLNYKVSNELIDTLAIARQYLGQQKNNLESLCKHFGIEIGQAHRACFDAAATMKLFKKLAPYLKN